MTKKDNFLLAIILILAGLGLIYGWRLFWFLTDDAYISFRYVSNSLLGYGYVWNPPPFRPVEGYTSFLWLVLLEMVWRSLAIPPPESSGYISLLFSYGTLLVSAAIIFKMKLISDLRCHRNIILALTLLGILTNRTFLAWTSSGLETAMFNFFIIFWVYLCIYTNRVTNLRLIIISSITSCIALTRPDGLLFAAALISALTIIWLINRRVFAPSSLLGITPLLLIIIHLIWRKHMYGEWLPNTYYAKVVSSWPESGIRYLVSFIIEYALWFWLGFLILCLLKSLKDIFDEQGVRKRRFALSGMDAEESILLSFRFVAVATLLIHFVYYTFIVGGDYFEFRVFSHLVPLIFISFLWFINFLEIKIQKQLGLVFLLIMLTWPVQWLNWHVTRQITTTPIGNHIFVPIRNKFPGWIRWYADIYDNQQSWLINHFVCLRHQEHKNFYEYLKRVSPSREEGLRLPADDFPVLVSSAQGVFGWSLPRINIIDKLGLNDYVVARNPVNKYKTRLMAHERTAPVGYLECFAPNVEPHPQTKKPMVTKRIKKLTEQDIVNCEEQWAIKVKGAVQEIF